jgi:hypothetical protein
MMEFKGNGFGDFFCFGLVFLYFNNVCFIIIFFQSDFYSIYPI